MPAGRPGRRPASRPEEPAGSLISMNVVASEPAGSAHGKGTDGLESLEITIDASDLEASAAFWSAALGYERLYERPPYVVLAPLAGAAPRVLIQQVGTVGASKGRVHLDLRVHDPAREVARLVQLGANVQEVVAEAATSWTVMTDPAGTPFCVCSARPGG